MSLSRSSMEPFRQSFRWALRQQPSGRRGRAMVVPAAVARLQPKPLVTVPRVGVRSIAKVDTPSKYRQAVNEMFDSMERDMQEWGLDSRLPAFGFPGHRSMFPSLLGGGGGGRVHLDLQELDEGFVLSADLPGMRKEDITVDVDNETGILTVAGERKEEHEAESDDSSEGESKFHYMERSRGKATRSIRLPDTADTSKATAAYTDGVLTLKFPKREAPSHRRQQIPVGGGDH